MKMEEIARWRDNLNFVSRVLEELCNYASDDEIRALRKLDVVIDGLYNLEQKLIEQNRKKKDKVKKWQEAIDSYIEAKKDTEGNS